MSALVLAAASATATPPLPMRISELAARPAQFEGRKVRLCGWAANGFERQYLAERKASAATRSVSVTWLADEPKIWPAERRCVVGVVTAGCAKPEPAPPGTEILCIGADWTLKQTERATR